MTETLYKLLKTVQTAPLNGSLSYKFFEVGVFSGM